MSADDHRALIRDSLRSFVARRDSTARARALRGKTVDYDRSYWQDLASLGVIGALVPPADGGLGLGLGEMVEIVTELASALAPEPVVPVAVGVVGLLGLVDNSTLARQLLPRIAEGTCLPALAWQEPLSEGPTTGETRIARASGVARLSGRKRFVLPAHCDGWLVYAECDSSPALCWVDASAPGVAVEVEVRADGMACADVRFSNVVVAPELLAQGASLSVSRVNSIADACTICVAAELTSVAALALRMTLDYLKTRKQFGRPLGSFQALQHRAVDLYVELELARTAVAAAAAAGAGDGLSASRAKARAAEAAMAICCEAVQMHGAMGFADECDVGLCLGRAMSLAAWLGNAAEHRHRVAKLAPLVPQGSSEEVSTPIPTFERLDWDALPDDEFRLRTRFIFETEYPNSLRNPPRRLRWKECAPFYRRLAQLGLLALAWPKEHGGAGLSPRKQLIFMQEQDRWGVARAPDMGITMVGPALIRYGTPAQQQQFLPSILSFESMWCQGFSEPDAGSDLASLRTEARRADGGYEINGAKLWTTFAQDATHMFMLARTDPDAKKQAGISVFLIDLESPGISVRPLRDIAGNEEFCEVRFDQVRVSADRLLGAENEGWTIAKMLLANERIYLGNPRQPQYALRRLEALIVRLGRSEDPALREQLTRLRLDVWDLAALFERFAEQVRRGEALGPDVSILKLFGSETFQRLSEMAVAVIGSAGGLKGAQLLGGEPDDVMSLFLNARPATIYGGSSEVQRNLLAKQVLDLPSA